MRYIRFLKPPKVQDNHVKALITITSDLGESFCTAEVHLLASLRSSSESNDVYLSANLKWTSGMRSLPMSLPLKGRHVSWPARVQVSVRNSSTSDHLNQDRDGFYFPAVVSAWSDFLDPVRGVHEATRTVQRRFTPLNNHLLCIWEETGESIARHIWDAGIALSAYLDQMVAHRAPNMPLIEDILNPAPSQGLNVIELGAGCGIVGISIAQTIPDCSVLLTDLPEAREIAEHNLSTMTPAAGSRAQFQELDWELPFPDSVTSRRFDLVLVADCTYNPDSAPALVRTLSGLVEKSPHAAVLLSMKVRHESELIFFDLMQEAKFVQKGKVVVPLPDLDGEGEDVLVLVFDRTDDNER